MALFLALSAEAVTVSASFTATGTGASLTLKNKDIATYSVSGTFVGTVKLERSLNGGATWEEISSVTGSATGTLTAEHPSGQKTNYRFRCSEYTSGTIVTSLVDADSVVQTFTDKHGSPVLTITDGGVSIPGTLSVTGATSLAGAVTSSGLVEFTAGASIASAATVNLESATGNSIDITGTTTITAITLSEGHSRWVRFTGALTLTNGASLVLPGAANITTAAGDTAMFTGYASGVVRCQYYTRLNGTPVATVPANLGGTGVANNAASTLTISGAYGTTLTVTGATSVTLPTSGTLATTFSSSQVVCTTGNGHGSTNTKIRKFSSCSTTGSDITYATSATLGDTFTINTAGLYAVTWTDKYTGGVCSLGISLNTTEPTVSIASLVTTADRVGLNTAGSAVFGQVSAVVRAAANDVIRAHDDGNPDDSSVRDLFRIVRIY